MREGGDGGGGSKLHLPEAANSSTAVAFGPTTRLHGGAVATVVMTEATDTPTVTCVRAHVQTNIQSHCGDGGAMDCVVGYMPLVRERDGCQRPHARPALSARLSAAQRGESAPARAPRRALFSRANQNDVHVLRSAIHTCTRKYVNKPVLY